MSLAALQKIQRTLLSEAKEDPEKLLAYTTVTANRVQLLQRSERWRSSLKEVDLAITSLNTWYNHHQTNTSQGKQASTGEDISRTTHPMAFQQYVHLHCLRGLALAKLTGKKKGPEAAKLLFEKILAKVDQNEKERHIYVDMIIVDQVRAALKSLQTTDNTPPTAKSNTKTTEETAENKKKKENKDKKEKKKKKKEEEEEVKKNTTTTPLAASTTTALGPPLPPSQIPTEEISQILRVGYMYVNTGKLQKAVQVFNDLLKVAPTNVGALLGRGR